MAFVVTAPQRPVAAVHGGAEFPVRRIFCIGRNYADHVREMGGDPRADPPVFFGKPADAVVASGSALPYPAATADLHYEGELVIALGGAGRDLATPAEAGRLIFGQACGCDLTRRDLQAQARERGGPWDVAKAFDRSAPLGPIVPVTALPPARFDHARLRLTVNGEMRQDAPLAAMIWSVPEILMALSRLFELQPGDLVFTGTPQGVGALLPGDRVRVAIDPLPPLEFEIAPGPRS